MRDSLEHYWQEKGYVLQSATSRYVVAWKPKDAPKSNGEHAVLLAALTLSKQLPAPSEEA